LALGANIGTCATALLSAVGRPREGLRAAVVHVFFNVVGVLLWLPFIDLLAAWATAVSPQTPELAGLARRAAETPRQVANAHTLFNVANTVLLVGLVPRIARWVERWVPDLPPEEAEEAKVRFLDTSLLDTPSLALDRVRLEILHLGERVQKMLQAVLPAVLDGGRWDLEDVARMDEAVDRLHGTVITYLGRLSQAELTDEETREMMQLMEAANSLENIGDIVETNLVNLGYERIDLEVTVSEATRKVLEHFHEKVSEALALALQATADRDTEVARKVVAMKTELQRMAEDAAHHGARRLVVEAPRRLAAYTTETDILQNLRRVYYFVKRIVRALVPEAG
ncbi:MAG: Na/Pi cotransporter family protein, partial [Acidobacteria bacterium]|nr:Na/Pi cotransporter family protein [Acidobacteriota bacterium]